MRRALIVGIDAYPTSPLAGCVNDANKMMNVLAKNEDGSRNFDCKKLVAPEQSITKASLKKNIEELFSQPADVALLNFSGHGTESMLGGYLVTPDARCYDEGVPMVDILNLANNAKVQEVVIILDCCDSGAFGTVPIMSANNNHALLREGISVLTASRSSQVAMEAQGSGIFTSLILEALCGGASDVLGNVTIANVYAFVDQILGAWDQRPIFKSHVSRLLPLRKCKPLVELMILRLLPMYFPTSDYHYPLDPSYESDNKGLTSRSENHEEIFKHLQMFRDAGLLVPVGEKHLYFAAMNSASCKLTPLGVFYWHLAREDKL